MLIPVVPPFPQPGDNRQISAPGPSKIKGQDQQTEGNHPESEHRERPEQPSDQKQYAQDQSKYNGQVLDPLEYGAEFSMERQHDDKRGISGNATVQKTACET